VTLVLRVVVAAALLSAACSSPHPLGDPCLALTSAPAASSRPRETSPEPQPPPATYATLTASHGERRSWEDANPILPLARPPLGLEFFLKQAKETVVPARVRLGRWLFYDPRLSDDNRVSCATCHRPEHAFSEPAAASVGAHGRTGKRKSPSLINQAVTLAWHYDKRAYFAWDGRAGSLEQQIGLALDNPVEMGNTPGAFMARLSSIRGYAPYFKEVFGSEAITAERAAQAIADYVRTRVSGNSSFDRWNAGEAGAMSAAARQGQELFYDKARCGSCHIGENFTDGIFHNLGVGWDARTNTFRDEGRFLVSGNPRHRGAFKSPGLRDVNRRAPYMHDGSLATLRDVVDFYNQGGIANPCLSPGLKPLGLTVEEAAAIVAFLQALDGEGYQDTPPLIFPQ
jgi:cytochrome c peroxidase